MKGLCAGTGKTWGGDEADLAYLLLVWAIQRAGMCSRRAGGWGMCTLRWAGEWAGDALCKATAPSTDMHSRQPGAAAVDHTILTGLEAAHWGLSVP